MNYEHFRLRGFENAQVHTPPDGHRYATVKRAYKPQEDFPFNTWNVGRLPERITAAQAIEVATMLRASIPDGYPIPIDKHLITNDESRQWLINTVEGLPREYRYEYLLAGTEDQPIGQRVAEGLRLQNQPRDYVIPSESPNESIEPPSVFVGWTATALEQSNYTGAIAHAREVMQESDSYWAYIGWKLFQQVLERTAADTRYTIETAYIPLHTLPPVSLAR